MRDATESYQRGQQNLERRDVGAQNRYEAWKNFRNCWLMLESLPEGKRPELYLLARDKVREAQDVLDRKCSQLLLEVVKFYNLKDWISARSTLDQVNAFFPANDQPCPWRAEQKRTEYGL